MGYGPINSHIFFFLLLFSASFFCLCSGKIVPARWYPVEKDKTRGQIKAKDNEKNPTYVVRQWQMY